jgi:mevalonate pyrophosphate decarboxylase
MKMTNIYKCHHIEKYKEKLKTEVIYFDDKIWNTIENKIVDFVDYFEKIYFNIIFQDLFLKKISQDIKIKNELSSNMGIILESNI